MAHEEKAVSLDALVSVSGGVTVRPGTAVYHIQKKDTVHSIAGKNGITDEELAALNGIPVTKKLYPGQTLLVPLDHWRSPLP